MHRHHIHNIKQPNINYDIYQTGELNYEGFYTQ